MLREPQHPFSLQVVVEEGVHLCRNQLRARRWLRNDWGEFRDKLRARRRLRDNYGEVTSKRKVLNKKWKDF
jgi:hypothetical protein